MISQGQQRAINALGMPEAKLIISDKEGPFVQTRDGKIRMHKRTFNSILNMEILHKDCDGNYVLNEQGEPLVQDPRAYGTPRRYK